MAENSGSEMVDFRKKLLLVVLVATILAIVIVTFNVLLLILAGVLIALFFRGFSLLLQRKLHLPQKLSLPIAIAVPILLLGLFFWLGGSKISQQVNELSETLPSSVSKAKETISQSPLGSQLLEKMKSPDSTKKLAATAKSFFRSTFGVLGDIYIILFLSLFFTASPKTYVHGFIKLFKPNARPRVQAVVDHVSLTLTKWLKGKIFSMIVVAVLTIIGLLIIGVPLAFTLGIIAGILNFIPNFGPLIAIIPAVLVALVKGPTTALLVAGLYILVQVLESNLITPQIQKRLIQIPPALIIISQLFMGVLTGGWGLVLATPLVAMLMVIVQDLWVKKLEKNA